MHAVHPAGRPSRAPDQVSHQGPPFFEDRELNLVYCAYKWRSGEVTFFHNPRDRQTMGLGLGNQQVVEPNRQFLGSNALTVLEGYRRSKTRSTSSVTFSSTDATCGGR